MYRPNGRMQLLEYARKQTEICPTVNRVRRVVRDQIYCGTDLELQSIRFDVHLICPNNLSDEAYKRHLDVIRPTLTFMLKG